MKSILSFIICISTTMYNGAISTMDGWLVSCPSCLLEALLPSSPSWSLHLALVPSCSFLWLLGPVLLWRNYFSRSWFCLVRRSIAVARVCTFLSRAIMRGSSLWWLLVAIEWVSTIQLFVWEMVVYLYYESLFPADDTNWCQKSLVSCIVLMCSRQNLWNRDKEDLIESTGMVQAKYPPKVKIKRISTSLECQTWENYAYLDLWELWGFQSGVGLTSVSWWKMYFLVEKIFLSARISGYFFPCKDSSSGGGVWDATYFHIRFLGDYLGRVGATWLYYHPPCVCPSHWNPSPMKNPSICLPFHLRCIPLHQLFDC